MSEKEFMALVAEGHAILDRINFLLDVAFEKCKNHSMKDDYEGF